MIPIINQSIQLSKFYYCQCHQKREWYFFLHGAKRLAGHFFSSKFHWDVATLISYHSEKSKLFILENSSMRMKSTKQVKEDIIYTMWKNSRKISNFPSFSHAALFLFGALKLAQQLLLLPTFVLYSCLKFSQESSYYLSDVKRNPWT